MEEASYLMDRPVGGWSELVTNHTLDLKFEVLDERFKAIDLRFEAIDERFEAVGGRFTASDERMDMNIAALRHEILAAIDRQSEALVWKLVTAVIAGMGVMGAIFSAVTVVA